MRNYQLLLFLLFSVSLLTAQQATPLFNGKDLSGWEQYGGTAPYTVEDGSLVGTAVAGTPNSFLCTDRPYGDFILELEFLNEQTMNSGIMFRAQHRAEGTEGFRRIFGYQMEIDPSPGPTPAASTMNPAGAGSTPYTTSRPPANCTSRASGTAPASRPSVTKFAPTSTASR